MTTKQGLDLLCKPALFQHFCSDLHADFSDDAEHIPLAFRSIRSDDKVRSCQCIEMCNVAVHEVSHIEEFPEFFRSRRGFDAENGIHGFAGGHMMATRAHSAYFRDNGRQFFHRSAFTEFFESAEFRNLEINIAHFPVAVKEYFDLAMAFKPCDRINCDSFHDSCRLMIETGKLKR